MKGHGILGGILGGVAVMWAFGVSTNLRAYVDPVPGPSRQECRCKSFPHRSNSSCQSMVPRQLLLATAFQASKGGRLALIEGRGIRHGDRYLATFDVKEVDRWVPSVGKCG